MSLRILRIFDILLSVVGILMAGPLLLLIGMVGFAETGSPIFRQERVGRFRVPFTLVKFRTMRPNTVWVATHLVNRDAITRFGFFLRRTKLDELPQLWNVLKGDMSIVGPRPCLFSQQELIAERDVRGVFDIRPGITGLAQISKIDMSDPLLLAETDAQMLGSMTTYSYFRYIFLTMIGRGAGDRVRSQ